MGVSSSCVHSNVQVCGFLAVWVLFHIFSGPSRTNRSYISPRRWFSSYWIQKIFTFDQEPDGSHTGAIVMYFIVWPCWATHEHSDSSSWRADFQRSEEGLVVSVKERTLSLLLMGEETAIKKLQRKNCYNSMLFKEIKFFFIILIKLLHLIAILTLLYSQRKSIDKRAKCNFPLRFCDAWWRHSLMLD